MTQQIEQAFDLCWKWVSEHTLHSVFILGILNALVLVCALGVSGGRILFALLLGLLGSPVLGFIVLWALMVTYWPLRIGAVIVPLLSVVLVVVVYGFGGLLLLFGQFLLLLPLSGLVLVTRLIQRWRHVFFTCPARDCAYRGLPAHVCPDCGEPNEKLWPNLYGLLWHPCVACGQRLPTLAILGRSKLRRQCGDANCRWPLNGRHAGKAPERLVAVAGGPTSGKSCYLLMTVDQITNHHTDGWAGLHGQIDVPDREETFRRERNLLAHGTVPAKTAKVSQAFLTYVKVGGKRCQLYLYDAPGEEFASLGAMSGQKYFPLLEGFILLVDPESFEAVSGPAVSRSRMSLRDVVNSTLGKALKEMRRESGGKIGKRVAVVIGKADIAAVCEKIGDLRKGSIPDEICRQAIIDWGGRNAVQTVENHFSDVRYFACSQLGRRPDGRDSRPFSGSGLIEPLEWILAGS